MVLLERSLLVLIGVVYQRQDGGNTNRIYAEEDPLNRLKRGGKKRKPLRSCPYSPSLTGRLAANGHPTAGASLWQCEKGRRCSHSRGKSCDTLFAFANGIATTLPDATRSVW
ncbi:MAG: hypothetical protein V7K40_18345 [Nostoc sp.]|uniref:hypothetical protein n=1 Tax=Nostoc sp. TaxID=1180 RepID=UPI002FF48D94